MKSRFTSLLVTLSVAGALALVPAMASANGANQFRNVPEGTVGAASGATIDVNGFAVGANPVLDRNVYANITFNNGVGAASNEQWLVTIIPMAVGTRIVLTPQGNSAASEPTTIDFTYGVSAAQNQLINAMNSYVTSPTATNFGEFYLLSLLRRLYP
jgi:hypothetical protein